MESGGTFCIRGAAPATRRRRRFGQAPLLALAVLIILPAEARAQGMVTGISLSPPSPVAPGTTVTVTVTARRPCGAIQIAYGDGQMVTYPLSTPPLNKAHVYPNVGSYTIVATGQGNCSGQVSTVLQVKVSTSMLTELCKFVDCYEPPPVAPRIEKIFSFPFLIEPGGTVLVGGKSFGAQRGDILLKLSSGGPAFPLVPVEGETSLHWDDVSAAGRIPSISGVRDQNATLQIRTRYGLLSNEWPVTFTAARDIRVVPQNDVGVTCSDEADHDECNDEYTIQTYDPFSWALGLHEFLNECPAEYSVCAYHETYVGSSNGTDEYRVSLKNDWVFDSMGSVLLDGFIPGGLQGYPVGATEMNLSVPWDNFGGSNWSSNSMEYRLQFFIVGPVGVPHR